MAPTAEPLRAFAALPLEMLQPVLDAEVETRRLYDYLLSLWGWKEPTRPLKLGWHIGAICEHLEAVTLGQIQKLIINVPPRTLKSTIVSVAWPTWEWIQRPDRQYIATSAAKNVVGRDALAMKKIVESEWYRSRYAVDWTLDPERNAKTDFANTVGGTRLSLTTGQRVTGGGADRIIVDDPIDASDAFDDKAQLVEHVRYFDNALEGRLNDETTDAIVVIMQRLHERDLSGHLLDRGDEYDHLFLPAEHDGKKHFTSIGWSDPRKKKGELLFPARLPAPILAAKMKSLTPRGYAGQYLQLPSPQGGAMFKVEWTRQEWIRGNLPEFSCIFSSWDCAFKKSSDSDFVVGQLWGVLGMDFFLLDQVRRKMDFGDTLTAIRVMNAGVWTPQANVIEVKANGRKVIQTLKSELPNMMEFDPQGSSKQERANAVIPTWIAKNVYLPRPIDCPWVAESFTPELLAFPNARRDDQVDAMTQAILWYKEHGPMMPWVAVL